MNTQQSNEEKKYLGDIESLSNASFGKQILLGALVADSIAMPVHWYYNQSAIERDFGILDSYQSPKKTHPEMTHRFLLSEIDLSLCEMKIEFPKPFKLIL